MTLTFKSLFSTSRGLAALLLAVCATFVSVAHAQEDVIRKNLAARMPEVSPIDEIRPTTMPGLYEVRSGNNVLYTDAVANFLIEGSLFDLQAKRNLTEERVNQLTAIKFDTLALKDAIEIKRGNGKRKLAVFEDPNCGYCKRLEQTLQSFDDITLYIFLLPILGPDSAEKSRDIWCAKNPADEWVSHMVRGTTPPKANCDSAAAVLKRNVEFGRAMRITGTPTLVFADGTRVPGALDAKGIEKLLVQADSAKANNK